MLSTVNKLVLSLPKGARLFLPPQTKSIKQKVFCGGAHICWTAHRNAVLFQTIHLPPNFPTNAVEAHSYIHYYLLDRQVDCIPLQFPQNKIKHSLTWIICFSSCIYWHNFHKVVSRHISFYVPYNDHNWHKEPFCVAIHPRYYQPSC